MAGTILLGHIAHIEWDDIGEAIPAFLTIILMPFTYSGAPGWGAVVRAGSLGEVCVWMLGRSACPACWLDV